ncbi:MAG: acyl--CoA ligase [Lachnospiraceae bacterium]|nr:acyl--CoA ligase [Lachnospiraceae bacterium]
MRIGDLLVRQADNDKIALTYGCQKINYKDWNEESKKVCEQINRIISKESKTVIIFLGNSINYAIAYFGITFSNRVIVPIGKQAKGPEIVSTVSYCESDMVITDAEGMEYLQSVFKEYAYKLNLFDIETYECVCIHPQFNYIEKHDEELDLREDENDTAIMLHTSGTTSNPKRVMLTHSNLINNIQSNIESLQLSSNDKGLIALPMFFGYCNTALFLTHVYLGAGLVIMSKMFSPKYFFELIQGEKITNFTGVPSMLLLLLTYRYVDKYDYSSLRIICFGGGKMPINKLEELIKKFESVNWIQTYGQTECSPRVTALLPPNTLRKIGSVGKEIPGVSFCIKRLDGHVCAENEEGEIVVNGLNVMKGYYKNSSETAKVKQKDGLHTGDIGYFDSEGFLYITGRLKNMIISGGINIYPEEIEQIILQHSGVNDVIVYGVDDDFYGERVEAKIVVSDEQFDLSELKEYCQSRMAKYKIPTKFEIVSELPKTYNGKLKRC